MTALTSAGRAPAGSFTDTARAWRVPMLWLAAFRVVLGIAAVPLAAFLYREHFVTLVLLRPTKEVLLAAGFLTSEGRVSAVAVLVAVIPLAVLGVWHFYVLGRAYRREITDCELPGLAGRVLSPPRINAMRDVLCEHGWWVVLVGRLTVFPSSVMAAAAGTSDMRARTFFTVDGIGAVLSVAEVYGAGLLLREAHEEAGPWLTAIGLLLFAGLVIGVGRLLLRMQPHRR